jgi:hypothetical protein
MSRDAHYAYRPLVGWEYVHVAIARNPGMGCPRVILTRDSCSSDSLKGLAM